MTSAVRSDNSPVVIYLGSRNTQSLLQCVTIDVNAGTGAIQGHFSPVIGRAPRVRGGIAIPVRWCGERQWLAGEPFRWFFGRVTDASKVGATWFAT
ncbi:MAG: hypothetical protein J4G15_05250 [Alphaproteobacteria bacterium]|nr:hypothetical protein [Alphaproteobacteria bacterium]